MHSLLRNLFAVAACLLVLHAPLRAQGMGAPQGPQFGSDRALNLLFKEFRAFSAEVQIDMERKSGKLTMELSLAWLDGAVRTEADLAKMKSPEVSVAALEQMVSMGFSPLVSISRPPGEKMHMLYPSLKAYAEEPLPRQDKLGEAKVQSSDLGPDEVLGHPCVKRKVLVVFAPGKTREYLVWVAKDLNNFPVRIQYKDRAELVTISFRKLQLTEPKASLFELPKDYTAYPNVRALMQGEMSKSMGEI